MHGAAAAQVFGCAGAVLSIAVNAPQAWTSCRRRRVAGLSPAARWTAVAQSATWLAYGVVEQVPLQVVTNLVCGLLHAAVLVALLVLAPAARRPSVLVPQALLALGWLALVALCARTGAAPLGLLAASAGVVATVPQLWQLARSPQADASGVSRSTSVLGLVAGLCWSAHGLLLVEPAVAVPSAIGAGAAAATLVLLRRVDRTSPPVRPVPALAVLRPRRPLVLPQAAAA